MVLQCRTAQQFIQAAAVSWSNCSNAKAPMSTAAHFDIEYLQYLKPDGSLAGPLPPAVPDAAALLPIFKQMLFLRTFDGKAIACLLYTSRCV